MKNYLRNYLLAGLAITLTIAVNIIMSVSVAADSLPVAPFTAHYTVSAKGMTIGEAVINLSDKGDGYYRMQADIRPLPILSLIIAEQMNESVEGQFLNNQLQPLRYHQQRVNGEGLHKTQLTFDWQNHQIAAQHNDKHVTLPLTERVIDPLSLHLLARWDLQQNRRPQHYTLVDETRLRTYDIIAEGEETIKTPLGALPTLRFRQQRAGTHKATTFWFAPTLDYLMVQMIFQKKGQERLKLVIAHVQ